MHVLTIEEAAGNLLELVHAVREGAEVVLMENDVAVAKLVSVMPQRPRAKRGSMKGMVLSIAEDFDATPEGFEDYV